MSLFTEVRNMIRKRHKCQFIVGQLYNKVQIEPIFIECVYLTKIGTLYQYYAAF